MDENILDAVEATEKIVRNAKDAVESVKKNYESLNNRVMELEQREDIHDAVKGLDSIDRSVGNQFVNCESFKSFDNNRRSRLVTSCKGVTTTAAANSLTQSSVVAPQFNRNVVAPVETELNIESLIPHLPTTSDTVQYMYGGALTNNAAVAPQNTKKGNSTVAAPTLKKCDILTFAHFTKITKQLADDAPALAEYINHKMTYGLQQTIELQIIDGNGNNQLSGLFNVGNYTDKTAEIISSLPAQNATLLDFLLIAIHKIKATGVKPECILLNPENFMEISLLKDNDGKYLLGAPTVGAVATLWGIPVITSNSVAKGKYLIANFTLGATIYDRQQITVEMSDSDENNFQYNLYTLRVERRLGLAIEHPEAIWGGSFSLDTGSN